MNQTLILRGNEPLARDTRQVFELLQHLRGGLLEVALPDGSRAVFGDGEGPGVVLEVRDQALFSRVLARGDIGLAESYLDGDWQCVDLVGLLCLLARNREVLRRAIYGAWWPLLRARLQHWLNRNSRQGSRRNIVAHYDLGNDFYALWLDPTMSYSSALFADPGATLAQAQAAKYERILDRLAAKAGQQVLEIGCGWGGFAEHAVARGLQLTGLTLSPAQLEWAQRRVPAADLRLQDYRDEGCRYDHIVSIEMFEAVGERYWPTYFGQLARCLKPGGRAVVQSIVIRDDLFASYRRGTDFIQQYVFPGGMLPSPSAFGRAAVRQGLRVCGEFSFGLDYARTLAAWRQAFESRWPEIAELGFDEHFRRLWRLYLAYCEAGFRAGNIDVVQFELAHR